MEKSKQIASGISLVVIGAASYGIFATMVGLSYREGFSPIEVVLSQYFIGLLALGIMTIGTFQNKKKKNKKHLKSNFSNWFLEE